MIPVNFLNYLRERAAYWVAAFLDRLDSHPFSAASVDAFLADGRGTAYMSRATREPTPIYDGLVAEKLAESRAVMAPLLNTEEIAARVEDGKADADLYDDLLDALVATPDQVWEMFDVATEADR